MNEELLVAAIFERAITDYESALTVLKDPLAKREDVKMARSIKRDVLDFAKGDEIYKYAAGNERVVLAFAERLNEIDKQHRMW